MMKSLRKCQSYLAVVAGVIVLIPSPNWADSTYTYAGNPFTNYLGNPCPGVADESATTCSLSISFTTAEPLSSNMPLTRITPQSFVVGWGTGNHITDDPPSSSESGPEKYLYYDATNTFFIIQTGASGQITSWGVTVYSYDDTIEMLSALSIATGQDGDDRLSECTPPIFQIAACSDSNLDGEVLDSPGTWTSTSSPMNTPENSSLALLGTGLTALMGMAWRRKRFAQPLFMFDDNQIRHIFAPTELNIATLKHFASSGRNVE